VRDRARQPARCPACPQVVVRVLSLTNGAISCTQGLRLLARAGPARCFRNGRGLLLPGVSTLVTRCATLDFAGVRGIQPSDLSARWCTSRFTYPFSAYTADGMSHLASVCCRFIEWDAAPAMFADAVDPNIPLSGLTSSSGSGFSGATEALFCKACAPSAVARPASLTQTDSPPT
jgi:hypothetical protein